VEDNVCLRGTGELHQLGDCGRIIQVAKPFCNKFPGNLNSRVTVHSIIIAQIILVEQQIYLLAAVAAKRFLIGNDRPVTGIAAMITRNRCMGRRSD